MPTEEELLAAIDADPDEDQPRLAHADWLDANGDPKRARFIRLQVRLARALPDEDLESEQEESTRLLEANRTRWLAGRPTPSGVEWYFRRGYPEEAAFTSRTLFEKSWRTLLVAGVRRVCFREVVNLGRVASCPGLARIRELVIWNLFLDDEVIEAILSSPHLSGLRELHIVQGRTTADSLAAIAARLPGLVRLTFNSSIPQSLAASGTRALATLSGLRSLALKGWRMADDSVRALWVGKFPVLASLGLRDCGIGPGGLAGLGDGSSLPALEQLDLGQNAIGDAGAIAVSRATSWTNLRWLGLARNVIGEPGAAALAGADHLAALKALDLYGNAIPDKGAQAFARHRLPALHRLNLAHNLIGNTGLRAVAGAGVAELHCHGNPADGPIIEAVESGKLLPPEATPKPVPVASLAQVVGPADEDALVRAILADPFDDLARAAYADWLEEQGKPLHAELQRLPPAKEERRRQLVEEVGTPAFQAFDCDTAGYPYLDSDGLLTVPMQLQGFVAKYFQARAISCLSEHHIERLALAGKLKDWARLAAAPAMAHLRALDLGHSDLRDDGAKVLAGCEGMSRLCALSLRWAHLRESGVESLCRSRHLGRLIALSLPDSGVTTASMRALADGPLAGQLRRLDLGKSRLGDADLAVLLNSRALCSVLVSLDLSSCGLTDRSAGALAASESLKALRSLDLSDNRRFTEAGYTVLAESALLRRLRRLRVVSPPVFNEFAPLARAAADIPGLTLVLSRPRFGCEDFSEMLGPRLILE
jgi:uncharacterized protein (TIGR02996 family)